MIIIIFILVFNDCGLNIGGGDINYAPPRIDNDYIYQMLLLIIINLMMVVFLWQRNYFFKY